MLVSLKCHDNNKQVYVQASLCALGLALRLLEHKQCQRLVKFNNVLFNAKVQTKQYDFLAISPHKHENT